MTMADLEMPTSYGKKLERTRNTSCRNIQISGNHENTVQWRRSGVEYLDQACKNEYINQLRKNYFQKKVIILPIGYQVERKI